MKTHRLFVFLLAFVLAGCAQQAQSPYTVDLGETTPDAVVSEMPIYTPVFEEAPCVFDLPQGLMEGEDVVCGMLVVPEDRDRPGDAQVRLAVAIFSAAGGVDSGHVPLVYMEGGPGVEVLRKLYLVYPQYTRLNEGRDLIFFDPRGVGLSEPSLDCPEYTTALEAGLAGTLTTAEAEQAGFEALAACGRRLLEAGINLSAYGVSEHAADLADLRTALGYSRWDIFAVSYGTRVVQEVLRTSPEGIRSVVLDSVVAPHADVYEELGANLDRALERLFAACATDTACSEAFPDLEEGLYSLAADLDAAPAFGPVVNPLTGQRFEQVPVDGRSLLNVVVNGLYSNAVIPYLPKLVADAARGDFNLLSSLRSNSLASQAFLSEGVYYAGVCRDEIPFNSLEAVEAAASSFPRLEAYLAESSSIFELCAAWGITPADAETNQPVSSDVPILVLAGQFDPASPPAWGLQASEYFSNGTYLSFEFLGHSVVLSGTCPMDIALAFFEDPDAPLDSTCMQAGGLAFITPTGLAEIELVPVSVPETGIQAIVPEDWIQAGADYYVSPDQSYELVFTIEQTTALEDFLAAWGAAEPGTMLQTGALEWTVYVVPQTETNKIIFLSVSPTDAGFYLALVVGPLDQAEAIRDHLFLPVLDAFRISG